MKPTSGGYHALAHRSSRRGSGFVTLLALGILSLSILADNPVWARTTQGDSSTQESLPFGRENDSLDNDPFNQEGESPDTPASPLQAPQESAKDVEIGILEEINPDSVGILESHQGGLGEHMWSGTSRTRASALMNLVSSTNPSLFVRDLMRRIVLSNARAPEGHAEGKSLVARRIDLLYEMGDIESMRALMNVAPAQHLSSTQRRAHIDGLLLAGDHLNACRELEQDPGSYREIYWRQLRIFCDLLSQKHDKVRLSLGLLRDTPSPEHWESSADQEFQDLVEYILNDREKNTGDNTGNQARKEPPALLEPTPLSFALARIGRVEIPGFLDKTSDPAILVSIASHAQLPLMMRIRAAEKAEKSGLLPAGRLQKLYESVVFSNDIIAQISQDIDQNAFLKTDHSRQVFQGDPTRTRALLLQAAKAQPAALSLARARLLEALYQQARQDGLYTPIARVSAMLLLELTPEHHLIWFAAEAIRALLTAREIDAALSWYSMIEHYAYTTPQAATIRREVWPLIQIADFEDRLLWNDDILHSWIIGHQTVHHTKTTEAQNISGHDSALDPQEADAPKHNQSPAISLILALLAGLGEPVTGDHWAFAWNTGSPLPGDMTPNHSASMAALINALRESSQSLRVAETVFLALACLGDQSPGTASPLILQEIVSALRHIGLDEEARFLALEAALSEDI